MHFYRILDDKSVVDNGGAILIKPEDLLEWNNKNYGIFWTLNEFEDGVRQKVRLIKINTWLVDLDDGTKQEQLSLLNKCPLEPSMIIETKNGHHAYWFAKDATPENYREITSRLVHILNGDKRARDYARILRVPDFYHCKDVKDKFLVKQISINKKLRYSEREMLAFIPKVPEEKITKRQKEFGNNGFWQRVNELDCEIALNALSGTEATGMQSITFRNNGSKTKQIIVDGKATSCWIDKNGSIGSSDGGGPTIAQWMKWYGLDYKEIARILKQYFPELED